jgi:hypothetical protein
LVAPCNRQPHALRDNTAQMSTMAARTGMA